MENIGIWIDTQEARMIRWDGKQSSVSMLYSGISRKPKFKGETSRKTKQGLIGFDYKSKQEARYREELRQYLQLVMEDVRNAKRLYIIGPAETKRKLEKMILREVSRYPQITAVDNADKLSDNQLREKVIQHFKAFAAKGRSKQ